MLGAWRETKGGGRNEVITGIYRVNFERDLSFLYDCQEVFY